MRVTKTAVALIATIAMADTAWCTESLKLIASVSPTTATIGQPITIAVSADVPEVSRLTMRNPFDTGDATSWTLTSKPIVADEKRGQGWRRTVTYKIAAFELGTIPLPTFTARYAGPNNNTEELIAEPATVSIESVLTDPASASLRDVRPPFELPYPRWIRALAAAAIGLALLVILWLIYWKLWGPVARLIRPSKRLDEWALAQLDQIDRERLIEHKKHKEYYTRLTDVVRIFLGKAWNFHAMDMTSSELLLKLQELEAQEPNDRQESFRNARQRAATVFDEADLVKFARHVPEQSSARHALDRAREVVRLARYKVEPQDEKTHRDGHAASPPPPSAPMAQQTGPGMVRS